MEEDDFLVEAAGWVQYYEKANEYIKQVKAAQVGDAPPQDVIDSPDAFAQWLKQCEKIYQTQRGHI